MLPVVLHWLRLLAWPAHLQADYSPGEIVAQTSWGAGQTEGALVLLAFLVAALAARRKAPVISFGLAWCAIALFPVHNVLVPTGIVLAERTLMLPSIGFVLVLGSVAALFLEHATHRSRLGLIGITTALLALGTGRSFTRHPVWSDQFNLWYLTATRDAPLSYRAHHALAELYALARADGRAEREYRLAIALAPRKEWRVYLDYANKLRARGFCYPAVPLYEKALEGQRNDMSTRASLIACLLRLGRYREARAESRLAISYGWKTETWQLLRNLADSALRVNAPPGSLNIRMADDSVASYLSIGTTK
jgi:tetratricopeptide (TPR) repeat protein